MWSNLSWREKLCWAAAFLEGEGSFYFNRSGRCAMVRAPQKDKECLDRLVSLAGGAVHYRRSYGVAGNPQWVYRLNGKRAVGFSMMLYPLMSSRRKNQIRFMITGWRSLPGLKKGTCARGHPYVDGSYYSYPGKTRAGKVYEYRACKECSRSRYAFRREHYGRDYAELAR